jgi:hypothetical protein
MCVADVYVAGLCDTNLLCRWCIVAGLCGTSLCVDAVYVTDLCNSGTSPCYN